MTVCRLEHALDYVKVSFNILKDTTKFYSDVLQMGAVMHIIDQNRFNLSKKTLTFRHNALPRL